MPGRRNGPVGMSAIARSPRAVAASPAAHAPDVATAAYG